MFRYKKTVDYQEKMNYNRFYKWLCEHILPNNEPRSCSSGQGAYRVFNYTCWTNWDVMVCRLPQRWRKVSSWNLSITKSWDALLYVLLSISQTVWSLQTYRTDWAHLKNNVPRRNKMFTISAMESRRLSRRNGLTFVSDMGWRRHGRLCRWVIA